MNKCDYCFKFECGGRNETPMKKAQSNKERAVEMF